ncbi:MAG: glycosyltransferase family 4 protein [Chloroflexi bacterium]|nr:glycosyltransferase family 4 protein [Chloroflexota bacterium]
MRIAVISPLEMRVPPVTYGGTELIVSLLTEELVRKGHEVTLFASADSITSAELRSVCPRFLRGTDRHRTILNILNALTCLETAGEFDIIHNHTTLEGMSLAGLTRTPMLTTLHGDLNGDFALLFQHYTGWYNTISRSAKSLLPPKERFAGVIYNAIDVQSYPFNGSVSDSYLLFLSRLSHEKGPHLAIEVARKLGKRLIIAGNVDAVDEPYVRSVIMPEVDGDQIELFGEANYHQKRELMAGAYCLLAPITWQEPFGLFMAESMACGTPVVVFNRGSAPEVVRHCETGFVVDTLDEMAEAVGNVRRLDRAACRQHVERNFNTPRMADDYLAAYESILTSYAALEKAGRSPARV